MQITWLIITYILLVKQTFPVWYQIQSAGIIPDYYRGWQLRVQIEYCRQCLV